MRRIKMTIALVGAGAALLFGAAAPAQAAPASPAERPASVASDAYHFGAYYTLDACTYFGNSLVQGGAFDSYRCSYEWNSTYQEGYWHLYMW